MDVAEEADAFASAHAVLLSEDLFASGVWPCLDGSASAKRALRVVCHAIRRQVDALVSVVASPSSAPAAAGLPHLSGVSSDEVSRALERFPCVRELTLFNVSSDDMLASLNTTKVPGLESLVLRQVCGAHAWAQTTDPHAWDHGTPLHGHAELPPAGVAAAHASRQECMPSTRTLP
jgi:hypothetical protein